MERLTYYNNDSMRATDRTTKYRYIVSVLGMIPLVIVSVLPLNAYRLSDHVVDDYAEFLTLFGVGGETARSSTFGTIEQLKSHFPPGANRSDVINKILTTVILDSGRELGVRWNPSELILSISERREYYMPEGERLLFDVFSVDFHFSRDLKLEHAVPKRVGREEFLTQDQFRDFGRPDPKHQREGAMEVPPRCDEEADN